MSLNISREIQNVRYLYIGELTVQQMAINVIKTNLKLDY